MAEAFLRRYAGPNFEVFSAGLEPQEIHPYAVQVMAEVGLDLSIYAPKAVDVFLGNIVTHTLITLCDEAEKNCPTSWPGVTRRLHWSIPDPAAVEGSPDEKLAAFRAARDQIDALVRGWLASQRPPRGV